MRVIFRDREIPPEESFTLELDNGSEVRLSPAWLYEELTRAGRENETLVARLKQAETAPSSRPDLLSRAEAAQNLAEENERLTTYLEDAEKRAAFAGSSFLRERTTLTPELALEAFGRHFALEWPEGGGQPVLVASLKGERITDPKEPAKAADVETALALILEAYPFSEQVRKRGSRGSGAAGNTRGADTPGLAGRGFSGPAVSGEEWIRTIFGGR